MNCTFIPGIISHGTLLARDLIPAFLATLRDYNPMGHAQITCSPFPLPPSYALEDDESDWWNSEDASWFLESLMDALDNAAPEGYHFGVHEGDGACFGFWPNNGDGEIKIVPNIGA